MVDIPVECHGSLFLLQPLNEHASDWLHEHVAEDAQRFVSALVVEPRYVVDILRGAIADGLGGALMRPWCSWPERRREIQQALVFAAAGVADLVNVDAEEDDAPRCPECGWIWLDDQPRCAGCGYPERSHGDD